MLPIGAGLELVVVGGSGMGVGHDEPATFDSLSAADQPARVQLCNVGWKRSVRWAWPAYGP